METLKDDDSLRLEKVHEKNLICSHLQEGVLWFERPGFLASS